MYNLGTAYSESGHSFTTEIIDIIEYAKSSRVELQEKLKESIGGGVSLGTGDVSPLGLSFNLSGYSDKEQMNLLKSENSQEVGSKVISSTGAKRIVEISIKE